MEEEISLFDEYKIWAKLVKAAKTVDEKNSSI
jgi:hypothetical protein